MYFSIIHFEIAYRLSISIKIGDLWMTLNGLMTADKRHFRGGWFFYVAFKLNAFTCGLHNLAGNWSWALDVDGRDRNETLVRLEAVSICFFGAL